MCRVLMYGGGPVLLDELLYQPDNSLINQTISSQMLEMLNLAGFGMTAWDAHSHEPEVPFLYRSAHVPVFDRNLKALAKKLRVTGLLAHVRGVPYHEKTTIGEQNAHPFHYEGCTIALAHNGDLAQFEQMRFRLVPHIKPGIGEQIRGNTDSEWIYALLLSQLDDPSRYATIEELAAAIETTLTILRDVRESAGIHICSPTNLFISDGRLFVGVRYAFGFGCYDLNDPDRLRSSTYSYLSLWYSMGTHYGFHDGEWKMIGGFDSADSVLVASEPLTRDTSTWLEVPEYSLFYTIRNGDKMNVGVKFVQI